MSASPSPITRPLLLWVSLLLALLFIVQIALSVQRSDEELQRQLQHQLAQDRRLLETSLQVRQDLAMRQLSQLAADRALRRALETGDAAQLSARLQGPLQWLTQMRLPRLRVHLPGRTEPLLRLPSASLAETGEELDAQLAATLADGQPRSGVRTGLQEPQLYGLMPVHQDGRLLAVLELGGTALPERALLERLFDAPHALLLYNPQDPARAPWLADEDQPGDWSPRLPRLHLPSEPGQALQQTLDDPREPLSLALLPLAGSGQVGALLAVAHPLRPLLAERAERTGERLLFWGSAWLLVQTLLVVVVNMLQHRLGQQQQALRHEHAQSQEARELLELVQQTQSAFITTQNHQALFDRLLQQVLEHTGSAFGFLGEVLHDTEGQPYLRTFAISNIAWDQASRDFYANHAPKGLEFRNLDSLFGQVLRSGEPLLTNAPAQHPHSGGTPPGHPPLEAFLGLPIKLQGQLVGMLGIANRTGGYEENAGERLQPLLACLGQLIEALRRERLLASQQALQRKQQQALERLNEIAARSNLASEIQLRRGLQLGAEFFGLDMALIARIEDEDYRVEQFFLREGQLESGQRFPLHLTYCQITRSCGDDVLAIDHMAASHHAAHPAYAEFGLESYIGIVLWVAGQRWGTLSFSARAAHPQPFDAVDLDFMRLLGRWVGAVLEAQAQDRERQQLLQRLTEQVPGIILQLQIHPDGRRRLPYASDALLDLTGLDPDDLREDAGALFRRIHHEDQAGFESSLGQSAQLLRPWQGEFRISHPTRGELWLGGQASPQRLADGGTLWNGLLLDISARKTAQRELTEERQRLRSVLEGANCGAWEWNVQTGEAHFDSRWLGLLGYRPGELAAPRADTWRQLCQPDDLELAEQAVLRHLDGETSHYQAEFRMRHKDGHWVWIQSRGRLLSRTSNGAPLMMYGTHFDISAQVLEQQRNRENQAFLQAVLDSSTQVSLVATDLEGCISLFNSGAEYLLGYQSAEVVGRHSPALFHLPSEVAGRGRELSAEYGEPVEGFAVFVRKAREQGSETRQWTYLHKDGSQRQVLLTVSLLYDAQAQLSGYLGIAIDISELVELSQALQASEQRFRGMVNNLPGAVYRCQNDADWSMLHISEGIERISGYPHEDFIDNRVRSYASVVLPEDLSITYEGTRDGLQAHRTFELSYRIRHRNGHIVWVGEKGRGQYDEHGRLQWIDGFIWDISEQRRAEQMVIEREAYLSTLLDNVIDAIVTIDERGLIESFNRAAERIFGYEAAEVLGRNVSLLMPEPDRSRHDGYISRYRDSGQARILGVSGRELLGIRSNGETFHIELAVSAIEHQGARRFIGVVRDITERRRIERMKNEFVATVSHELRTPLTSIGGALGLITGGALGEVPEAMHEMLQIAQQNSLRLSLLINDLLDMEKLVAGKMNLQLQPLELQAEVVEALRHNRPYADEHGVDWRLCESAELRVQADPQRLQQVLANLLSNAAKFSPPGSRVELRIQPCALGARVSVQDSGPGIPAEFQERIFSKFAQADASDTRQKGGTGLGLAICKELIERMHGHIGFDSPPGQGACFWFELPLAEEAP